MVKTRIIFNIDEFRKIRSQWNSLLQISRADNLFLRWEWLFNWSITFGNRYELAIILVIQDDKLIGIAPLYVNRRRLKKIFTIDIFEFMGSRFVGSDYLDFIIQVGKEEIAIERIIDVLKSMNCKILHLVNIRKDAVAHQIMRRLRRTNNYRIYKYSDILCPFIELPETWDVLLSHFKKKRRSNLRYYKKKAEKELSVTFDQVQNEGDLNFCFNTLIELNKSRMKEKRVDNVEGTFFNNRFVEFHRQISRNFLKENLLKLYYLKDKENKIIACKYNFIYKNKVYSYQGGMIPEHEKFRLGTVMLCYCIENAIKEGAYEYDFLEGDEQYKYEWTKTERIISSYYIYKDNAFNRILFGLLSSKSRVKKLLNLLK